MASHPKFRIIDKVLIEPGESLRFALISEPQSVRQVLKRINEAFSESDVPADRLNDLEIVLAEALNNIVEHAYSENTSTIEITVSHNAKNICVSLQDRGKHMPGGKVPLGETPSLSGDKQELPEGGFGWALIHELTTDLTYRREGDTNITEFCVSTT